MSSLIGRFKNFVAENSQKVAELKEKIAEQDDKIAALSDDVNVLEEKATEIEELQKKFEAAELQEIELYFKRSNFLRLLMKPKRNPSRKKSKQPLSS